MTNLTEELRSAFQHRAFDKKIRLAPIPPNVAEGKYAVITDRRLGTGGLGEVYEATDTETGLQVVVKFLRGSEYWPQSIVDCYRTEVKNLAHVAGTSSKSIVLPLAYGRDTLSKLVYIVMSKAEGVALNRVPDQLLSLKLIETWMTRSVNALSECHSKGIRHGDLKPSNIIVESNGNISIIDFGCSTSVVEGLTNFGYTPDYASPEHQDDLANLSYPSDVYSFGIVFDELWHRWQALNPKNRIPVYIQDILNSCLLEDPLQRLTADEIAKKIVAIKERHQRILTRRFRVAVVGAAIAIILAVGGLLYSWKAYIAKKGVDQDLVEANDIANVNATKYDETLKAGRIARATQFNTTIKISTRDVKNFRILELPENSKIENVKKVRKDFLLLQTFDNSLTDQFVLLLTEAHLAFLEKKPEPIAIHEQRWNDIADSLGQAVRADLEDLRGICLSQNGKHKEAIPHLLLALEKDASRSAIHLRIAGCWSALREHRDAENELTIFLTQGVNDKSNIDVEVRDYLLRDAYWFRASKRLFFLNDVLGAYADMQQLFVCEEKAAIRSDKEYLAAAYKTLGEAAYAINRDSEAVVAFSKAATQYKKMTGPPTIEDSIAIADCYMGIQLSNTESNPTQALEAAGLAESYLPSNEQLPPTARLLRAQIKLNRGIAYFQRSTMSQEDKGESDLKMSIAELDDSADEFQKFGLDKLGEHEMYNYALSLIKRAALMTDKKESETRLELYREGVKHMSVVAQKNPRYQATLLPAVNALSSMLALHAMRLPEMQAATRKAFAQEASLICKNSEQALVLPQNVLFLSPENLLFLRCMHRRNWIQASVVLKDAEAFQIQGDELFMLCIASGTPEQFKKLTPNQQQLIRTTLAIVAEQFSQEFLKSPKTERDDPVALGVEVVSRLSPTSTSSSMFAAKAAIHSRKAEFPQAIQLQKKALEASKSKEEQARLLNALNLYEKGESYKP